MASLDLQKYTIAKYSGLCVHLDQEKRMELNHSNEHIDKTLTDQNYFIGVSSFNEMVERIKHRTEEVDAILPPKRVAPDRVTAISIYMPCPLEIEKTGRADEFFQKGYEWLQERFGAENCHGMTVHKDEKHTYIDKGKEEKESLYHAHGVISPYTKEHGINAKNFMTREMLRDIQKEFNLYVYQEFGIEMLKYSTPERKTVEQLKQESKINKLSMEKDKIVREWNEWGTKYQTLLQEYTEVYEQKEEALSLIAAEKDALEKEKVEIQQDLDKIKRFLHPENFIQEYVKEHDNIQEFIHSKFSNLPGGYEYNKSVFRENLAKKARQLISEESPKLYKELQQKHSSYHMHM